MILFLLFNISFSVKIEKSVLEDLEENEFVNIIVISEREIENGETLMKAENFYIKLKVKKQDFNKLIKNKNIKEIYKDKIVRYFRETSIPIMKIDFGKQYFSLNGSGVNISIIDTGIYPHDELKNRIVIQKCFISTPGKKCPPDNSYESNNATDDNGHGTHVAGIAAGILGVASNSSIFAIKVLNSSGYGSESDLIKGINYSIANGAQIISLSLGSDDSCYSSVIDSLVDELTRINKTLFIAAAGNNGPGSNTISSPACAKSVIAVGAVNKNNLEIASFSSRGPTIDNRIKPDIVAIGTNVNSTYLYNEYISLTGTSMATPFVSGIAALIYEKFKKSFNFYPDPLLVKAILLTSTNYSKIEQRNNVYGSGLINTYEALRLTNNSFFNHDNKSKIFYVEISENNSNAIFTLTWLGDEDINLTFENISLNYSPTDNVEQIIVRNLTIGIYKIKINVSSQQDYFIVSSVPFTKPIIVYSPLNKSYNNSIIHFNVTLRVLDENINIFLNNESLLLLNDSISHYYNISNLTDGNYEAVFSTTYFNETIFFIVDTIKPILYLVSPINSSIINQSLVNVNFTIVEENLDKCWYEINSNEYIIENCSNFTINLDEGNYSLSIFSNDTAGNINQTTSFFKISLPPRYLEVGKNASVLKRNESVFIYSKWIDLDGLSFAIISTNESGEWINYSLIQLNNTESWVNFTWSNNSINNGIIGIRIYVNDSLGNSNFTETYVIKEDLAPYYTNIKIGNASYEDDIYLNISVFDDVYVDTVLIEINGINYTTNKSNNVYFFVIPKNSYAANTTIFFRWFMNDSANFYNYTDIFNITITKFDTKVDLFLNGNHANATVKKGEIINITSLLNTFKRLKIELNQSLIQEGIGNVSILLNTSNLTESLKYNVTSYYADETENYTFSFSTLFFGLCPICPNEYVTGCINNIIEKIFYVCNELTNYKCEKRIEKYSCISNEATYYHEETNESSINITNVTKQIINYLGNNTIFIVSYPENKEILINFSFINITIIFSGKVENLFLNFSELNDTKYGNLTIYKSFKIENNLTKIKNITIKFSVPINWILKNEINKSTISLYRISDIIEKIETLVLYEDNENIYFISYLNEMSNFIIAGNKIKICNCPTIKINIDKCKYRTYFCNESTDFKCIEKIEILKNCENRNFILFLLILLSIAIFIFLLLKYKSFNFIF
ncbi:MAG: S8 family serine peptidase [Candidatus Aenigmatarchaeota archaeon]